MSNSNLAIFSKWEFLVILSLSLITIIVIYVVSYQSGYDAGFAAASKNSDDALVKIPVSDTDMELDPDKVNDIYARLNDKQVLPNASATPAKVGNIETLNEKPLMLPEVEDLVKSEFLKDKIKAGYYVKVFEDPDLVQADQLAKNFRASGFFGVIQKNAEKYSVLIGPEPQNRHAELLLNQLKREKPDFKLEIVKISKN